MQHYNAVLFDVDGTLIDSALGVTSTLQEVFAEMGTDVSGVDLRRYLGPPLRKTFGEYYREPEQIERATELYRVSYAVKGSHVGTPYPGVMELLRRLREAGCVICTATCKPIEVVTPILHEKGLLPQIDFVGGASMDESRDTKTDVIRYVLAQPVLQGRRVLMVGDRNDDMIGAANCSIDAAAVLYGYGSREELAPFRPVFLAESCAELAGFILGAG